jgi:hypothetical protein
LIQRGGGVWHRGEARWLSKAASELTASVRLKVSYDSSSTSTTCLRYLKQLNFTQSFYKLLCVKAHRLQTLLKSCNLPIKYFRCGACLLAQS